MNRKQTASLLWQFLDRVASLGLLYSVLAVVFVFLLVLLALYTPEVSWYLLSRQGTLPFLTAAEQSHMADVQQLVFRGALLALGCVALLFIYEKIRGITRAIVRDAFIMTIGLAVVLVPFSWSFERFHSLFFPQGNWQFPLDSWLITHYPVWFFLVCAVLWIGGALLSLKLLQDTLQKEK